MAKKIELDIKLNPKIDKAGYKQQIKSLETDAPDINIGIDIDEKDAENAVADVIDAYQELEEAMSGVIALDVDTQEGEAAFNRLNKAIKDIENADFDMDKLASEFSKTKKEIDELVNKQKQALAQMKMTGQEGSEAYVKLQKEIDETEEQIREMGDAMGDLADVQEPEQFINTLAKFEALGRLGGVLEGFAEKGLEVKKALREVQAATGSTNEELEKLKVNAEDAFRSGVGESLADAIKIVGYGKQVLGDFLDDTEILKFTKAAQGIANVFDKDVNDVIAGSRTFIAQFGLEGQEAADLVALAMQNGASKMDDVLDTLDEYSQLTVKAGYSAEQMIGLMNMAMDKGLRDTDKLMDSIKESQIRLNAGDTSRALSDISGPVSEQIKGIVRLGEDGVKSINEVTKESAELLKQAYESGEITAAVRDQITTALGGTMAEDVGGEMWAEIFSANIDENIIRQQAAKAGAAIKEALGPITFFDKIKRELEAFAASAGEILAGTAQVVGSSLTTLSQVAPGISLLSTSIGPVKEMASSLVTKLAPGLVAAAKAQGGLNLAMLANPYVMIIAGVAALAAGIYFLADALHTSTAEAIEEMKAEDELMNKRVEINKQQRDSIKSDQALIKSFKDQGEAAQENTDTMINLARAYPGVTDKAKSYEKNLMALEKQTKKNNKELDTLDGELTDLANRTVEIKIKLSKLEIEKSMEELEDEISKGRWFDMFRGQAAANEADAREALLKPFMKALKSAKNDKELNKAYTDMQLALLNSGSIDREKKRAISDDIETATAAVSQGIKVESQRMEVFINRMIAGGAKEADVMATVAKEFELTKEEAAKLVEEQKKSNKEAEEAGKNAEEARKAAEAKRKAEEAATKARERRQALVQKELDNKLKELELDKELEDANREIEILKRGTDATVIDEIINQDKLIELLKDKLDVLNNTKGITKEQRDAIKQQIKEIENELKKEGKNLEKLKIESEIDIAQLDKELKEAQLEYAKKKIEIDISLGIADESALEPLYEAQLYALAREREKINSQLEKADDIAKRGLLARLEEINKEELDIDKEKHDSKIALIERAYDREKSALDRQTELMKRAADEQSEIWENIFQAIEDASITAIDLTTDKRLDALDERQQREMDYFVGTADQEEALQEKHEKQKTEIIKEAEDERLMILSKAAGARFALENEELIKSMELQKEALELDLQEAINKGDYDKAEEITNQIAKMEDAIVKKGSKIGQAWEIVAGNVDDIISNMFAGNTEGMKSGMKEVLATVVGFITQLISLWAWELVLQSNWWKAIAALAPPGSEPAVIAAGQATVANLLNLLLTPLLNVAKSWPTGGIFDQPTLAMIGDGSTLGGENREILLRDDQLLKVIDMALERNNAVMASYFNNLINAISQRRVIGELQGSTLLLWEERAHAEEDRRNV